jgi:hypothetical protein
MRLEYQRLLLAGPVVLTMSEQSIHAQQATVGSCGGALHPQRIAEPTQGSSNSFFDHTLWGISQIFQDLARHFGVRAAGNVLKRNFSDNYRAEVVGIESVSDRCKDLLQKLSPVNPPSLSAAADGFFPIRLQQRDSSAKGRY